MIYDRRFLVKDVPVDAYGEQKIKEYYLYEYPQLIISQVNDDYFLTIKLYNGKEVITNIKKQLTAEEFLTLKVFSRKVTKKTKKFYKINDKTIEINFYKDTIIADVRFHFSDDADEFVIPDWFGDEVTGKILYSNISFAEDVINEDDT